MPKRFEPMPRAEEEAQHEEGPAEKAPKLTPEEQLKIVRERYIGSPEKEEAFAKECVRLATPMIRGMMRGKTKLQDDYEDVLQTVTLKALRKLQNFEGRSSLKSWLFVISMNEVKDFIGHEHAGMRDSSQTDYIEELLEGGHDIKLGAATPEDIAIEENRAACLYEAIEKSLNPSQKLAIDLICFKGMSIAEVVAMMPGENAETIKVRLFRARARLRTYLERHGFKD